MYAAKAIVGIVLIALYTQQLRPQMPKKSRVWHDTEEFRKDFEFTKERAMDLWRFYRDNSSARQMFLDRTSRFEEFVADQINNFQGSTAFQDLLDEGTESKAVLVEPFCICGEHQCHYNKNNGLFTFRKTSSPTKSKGSGRIVKGPRQKVRKVA